MKSGVHGAQKRKYALKRVKIDEKLLWSGVPIQEFANALSNGTIPTPYGLPFPKIGGSQPQPKTVIAIISGMVKATNFQFCVHILGIDRNKSPLKISAKVAVGVIGDSRKFSGHPYRSLRAVIFAVAQLSCYRPTHSRTFCFLPFIIFCIFNDFVRFYRSGE